MGEDLNVPSEMPDPDLAPYQAEFLRDRLKECESLGFSLAKEDFLELSSAGHRWKGFSEPYGFGKLGKLAISLEKASKEKNSNECRKLLEMVSEYLREKEKSL